MKNPRKTVLLYIIFVYVIFLFYLALFQFPTVDPPTNFIPMHSMITDWTVGGRGFVVNFIGNIVAFIPIGLIPVLARRRRSTVWQAGLFCLGLSMIIEGGQYVSRRRVTDVDDLILNTIGGVIGYGMYKCLGRCTTRNDAIELASVSRRGESVSPKNLEIEGHS